MKVIHQERVRATPAAIFEYMTSAPYLDALVKAIDAVSSIEELESRAHGEALERRVRYEAPTAGKIPSFLKKYQDKAPAHVRWEEQGSWDASRATLSYKIVPEVPEHWHKKYSVSGQLKLIEEAPGQTTLLASLEYHVKVFGLGASSISFS
jgi:hypothetical protein